MLIEDISNKSHEMRLRRVFVFTGVARRLLVISPIISHRALRMRPMGNSAAIRYQSASPPPGRIHCPGIRPCIALIMQQMRAEDKAADRHLGYAIVTAVIRSTPCLG